MRAPALLCWVIAALESGGSDPLARVLSTEAACATVSGENLLEPVLEFAIEHGLVVAGIGTDGRMQYVLTPAGELAAIEARWPA
jgi:hypothetical protein